MYSQMLNIYILLEEVIHGLKGKQLPPPKTAYRKYFDKCGIPNFLVGNLLCLFYIREKYFFLVDSLWLSGQSNSYKFKKSM